MKLLLILSLAGVAFAAAAIQEPVRMDAGLVSGASTGSDVRVFKGIPYAAPPVGELRWRPPAPAAHWEGVRKGDEFGPVCMQNRQPNATPAASEDCGEGGE
jgi:para-nitrobenzyl esterase